MHARWSMLGAAGAVAAEATGYGTWVDAQPTTWDGTAKYPVTRRTRLCSPLSV